MHYVTAGHGTPPLPLGHRSAWTHIASHPPGLKSYKLGNAAGHYGLCHQAQDGNARLTNLLLTMMQQMEVNTEQFVDRLGPVSEVVA